MKEFSDILKAFRRLMYFSLSLAGLTIIILLFKFNVQYIPESQTNIVLEEVEPEIEEYIGEIGSIDPESGLIIDKGFNVVKTQCGACHSTKLVAQNRFSREGWLELIRWMQKSQNLWDLGEQEGLILDYLEKNFAPKNIGRRKPLENIEWYVLKE